MSIDLILYIVAALCFILAAAGAVKPNWNWLALGLLAWVLTNITP